jgi:hypothetical protein
MNKCAAGLTKTQLAFHWALYPALSLFARSQLPYGSLVSRGLVFFSVPRLCALCGLWRVWIGRTHIPAVGRWNALKRILARILVKCTVVGFLGLFSARAVGRLKVLGCGGS